MTADERHHGADRQVDPAADDDEGDAQGEDAVDRRREQDPDRVVDRARSSGDSTEKTRMMSQQGGERQQPLERV